MSENSSPQKKREGRQGGKEAQEGGKRRGKKGRGQERGR
jgi:hypothetical protein